ncbi:MAG: hydrogenase maturation protease [Desulfobacteraceae bacterium]|nr:hydrogenase maturation protease [Desulfobacteraceae bacterium]
MTTEIYEKPYLVFGCGNTLFGNDGFGPEVVDYLTENYTLPDSVLIIDAGTGIRDFIFDLLLVDQKPELVIVIDAVTMEGRKQGEVFEIDLDSVPKEKLSDFSLHQSPSSNLLSQLKDRGIAVEIIAMHTKSIPNEINPGLCPKAQKAIKVASEKIIEKLKSRVCF